MNKPLLAPSQEKDLHNLLALLAREGIEAVLIGAFAVRAHLPDVDRQTEDVDLALAVNIGAMEELETRLREAGWERPGPLFRWLSPARNRFDLIPAGSDIGQELRWRYHSLSLVGFQHLYKDYGHSLAGAQPPLKVASAPVLILLKIVSYMDNPEARQKDLSDLILLLRSYPADDQRLFSDTVFNAKIEDFEFVRPFLAGLDVGGLSENEERDLLNRFLGLTTGETPRFEWQIRQAARTVRESEETTRIRIRYFKRGFRL